MKLNKKPYKGCRDFFPKEKRIQDYIFAKMEQTAQSFGHEHYDGPLLEEVELYKAKSGEELINDQIYSFEDRGKRFVAIRPEMTPSLARMVAQIYKEASRPIRWYSIPNLMRYEKPQRGRLREHWQLNCDIFGAPEGEGELEILTLAVTLFENLGASNDHFEILLNDRRIVDGFLVSKLKLDKQSVYRVYKIIDRSKKIPAEELDRQIGEVLTDSKQQELLKSYLSLRSFEQLGAFLQECSLSQEGEFLSQLVFKLQEIGLGHYFAYDPCIVRGLDYYTGLVFEIYDKHPENRRALCGGGAYANLLQIFGEGPLAGIGFGLGDVTLKDFLVIHELLPDLSRPDIDLFLPIQVENALVAQLKIARKLRSKGIKVLTHGEVLKMKKVFPLAAKKGAKFVGLLGEQELQNNQIQIKNLDTKQQCSFNLDELAAIETFLKS